MFFLDECHLIGRDICGYVWGKTDMRIEIPLKNEKEKQTSKGAINYRTGKLDFGQKEKIVSVIITLTKSGNVPLSPVNLITEK